MHAHSALKTTFFFLLFSPWRFEKIINIEIQKTTKHIYYLENVGYNHYFITFVVKRGPLTLMLKVSSIMSGVTVSSVTFLLMPALFISRFRPPSPTLDSTNFLASSIVFISLTSVNTTRKNYL